MVEPLNIIWPYVHRRWPLYYSFQIFDLLELPSLIEEKQCNVENNLSVKPLEKYWNQMFNKFIEFKSDINRKIGGGMPKKIKQKAKEEGHLSNFQFLKDDHPYVLYKVNIRFSV